MAGPVPAIHDLLAAIKTWMAVSSIVKHGHDDGACIIALE
jgi:hypothetical protein